MSELEGHIRDALRVVIDPELVTTSSISDSFTTSSSPKAPSAS